MIGDLIYVAGALTLIFFLAFYFVGSNRAKTNKSFPFLAIYGKSQQGIVFAAFTLACIVGMISPYIVRIFTQYTN